MPSQSSARDFYLPFDCVDKYLTKEAFKLIKFDVKLWHLLEHVVRSSE